MRIVNAILLTIMLLFMAVQYNDPDGLLWIAIYAVPAGWCAMAVFWRQALTMVWTAPLLVLSLVGSLILMNYYWPSTPDFWRQDIWWEVETAREGMGMMIVSLVLLFVAVDCLMLRRRIAASKLSMNAPAEPPAEPVQNH